MNAALSNQETASAKPHVEDLVLNWHVTEACNYCCRYCYSAWQRQAGQLDALRYT